MDSREQVARMEGSYKAAKEAFVSNHSGSGIWEINYVTFVAPVSSCSGTLPRYSR